MVHIFGVRNFLVNGVGCPKLETEANVTQIPIYFENFSSASRILQTLQPGNKQKLRVGTTVRRNSLHCRC